MDAIEMLETRVSVSKLMEPGPTDQQLNIIKHAALRAPDHARLRPWRFIIFRGPALDQLGDICAQITQQRNPQLSVDEIENARKKVKRAPLVIIAISAIQEHPKVPEIEQILSTGAGVQNMLNAAHALGLGAIWRTGEMAYDQLFHQALNLKPHEKVLGFIYFGTPVAQLKTAELEPTEKYFADWSNQ